MSSRAGFLAWAAILLTAPLAARADEAPLSRATHATAAPFDVPAPPSTRPATAPFDVPAPPTSTESQAAMEITWLRPSSVTPAASLEGDGGMNRAMWLALPVAALGVGAALVSLARRRRRGAVLPSGRLRVDDAARVGPRAQVVVVTLGERRFLLGVTEQSVQRLAVLPSEPAVDSAAPTLAAPPATTHPPALPAALPSNAPDRPRGPSSPFAHLLRSLTFARDTPPAESDAALRIAAETRDVVVRSAGIRTEAAPPVEHERAPEPTSRALAAEERAPARARAARESPETRDPADDPAETRSAADDAAETRSAAVAELARPAPARDVEGQVSGLVRRRARKLG